MYFQVPAARAAILWVLGEYSERVPKVAPDVLRKMAKNFTQEETEVKMQVLNLATKLALVNPEQTELLAQVVFFKRVLWGNFRLQTPSQFSSLLEIQL